MKARLGLLVVLVAVLLPDAAWSRVGGGQSYSGSRGSSSSSSGSRSSGSSSSSSSSSSRSWSSSSSSSGSRGSSSSSGDSAGALGLLFQLFFLLAVVGVLVMVAGQRKPGLAMYAPSANAPRRAPAPKRSLADQVRAEDPTFSEPVFLEWATLLFIRGQQARARGVTALSPWFDDVATALPRALDGRPMIEVKGVVVGSARLTDFSSDDSSHSLEVAFRACLTAGGGKGDQSYYLEERWSFRRARGVASRVPEDVEKLGCHSCGSAFEKDPMGTCPHCSAPLQPGEHDWAVQSVVRARLQPRPSLLTGEVEEEGTSLPSVRPITLVGDMRKFAEGRPGFSWPQFDERARSIFLALQAGWSAGKWEQLRAFETEAVFQSHRFWMEEYRKQGLQNRLEDVRLARVEVVKVATDACYESVTCRMHASMRDFTVRLKDQQVVAGNQRRVRPFTEYWTFLRRPGAQPKEGAGVSKCPGCGAPLKITQAGVCEYCQAKVSSGAFDWVLSRIEQDEEYQG